MISLLASAAALLALWGPMAQQDPTKVQVDAYVSLGQPGSQHAALCDLQGSWLVAGRMRFGPAEEWEELFASVEIEPLLGGRFIAERILGDQTRSWPTRYQALRILGYDNATNQYVYSILNSFQTGMMSMRGQRAGDTLTLKGPFVNPLNGRTQEWKTEYRYLSQDRFAMLEYPRTPDGLEYVGIEAVYTRLRSDNPLEGVWKGTYVRDEVMTFAFERDGTVKWRIEAGEMDTTFQLRYRVDFSTTPHPLELYGFSEGPLAGKTMFGILSFEDADTFRLDLEPGPAGSLGEDVRPSEFTDSTLRCRRR